MQLRPQFVGLRPRLLGSSSFRNVASGFNRGVGSGFSAFNGGVGSNFSTFNSGAFNGFNGFGAFGGHRIGIGFSVGSNFFGGGFFSSFRAGRERQSSGGDAGDENDLAHSAIP